MRYANDPFHVICDGLQAEIANTQHYITERNGWLSKKLMPEKVDIEVWQNCGHEALWHVALPTLTSSLPRLMPNWHPTCSFRDAPTAGAYSAVHHQAGGAEGQRHDPQPCGDMARQVGEWAGDRVLPRIANLCRALSVHLSISQR